jgi:hypothetical protein
MRLVRLGKIAAQAEALRLRRLVRRQAMRGVFAAVAALFGFGVLAWLHVAGCLALTPRFGPTYAALIVAGVDVVFAAICGALAAFSSPDRIEREALLVREEARSQMAEAAVMAAVIGPILRRAGLGLVDRLIGGRPRRR